MPDDPSNRPPPDLLAEWRLTEHRVSAARAARSLAETVEQAAEATEEAAEAARVAAHAALDAALGARAAAARAANAADRASEESQLHVATAHGDKARADQAVDAAVDAEAHAHERFRESKNGGMDERRWAPSTSPSEWTDAEPDG
jgi:outer membrane protease